MKILWLTWKDKKNPLAGGAELVNESLAKRLVIDGHELILLVAGFPGALGEEIINGYKVIRLGNRWTVYWLAYKYYKKNLVGWADLVIDEINTIPFFAKFYVHPVRDLPLTGVKERNIILCYQLCREIWFYQTVFPLSLIGYLIEPLYLWLLRKQIVLTESESTKRDMQKYGYEKDKIHVFNVGLEMEPVKDLKTVSKYVEPTILCLGAIRGMKQTLHSVKAFEIAKEKMRNLKLIIAGDANSSYGRKVLDYINNSKYKNGINYLGKVSIDKKIELMQKSHLICVTSVKEGWGIIVTEANSQGTPAVVYNVDGLRDAVKNNQTGLICSHNTPENLAENIVNLIHDKKKYASLQENGWRWSKEINFENSYKQFVSIINE